MWVNFDRRDEGISSLKVFHDSLKALKEDQRYLKYCIIAIHNALQTYICIALSQGNSFNHWKKRDLEEWLKKYDDCQELSLPDLDNFLNLYKRLFDSTDSRVYDQIRWLNDTRNTFIHFNIDSLSFNVEQAMKACSVAFQKIIESVSMAKGIVFYTDAQKLEFETIINNIRHTLEQTK